MNDFDSIAPYYDSLVNLLFGGLLGRAERRFLSDIRAGDHLLILGGGTGRILYALSALDIPLNVTYLDSSAEMIRQAKRIPLPQRITVQFDCTRVEEITPSFKTDHILSFYFLDCFTDQQLETLIPILAALLKSHGSWLFTDFIKPHRGWHRLLIWLMYRFFRLVSNLESHRIPDYQRHFDRSGLMVDQCESFAGGLISSGIYRPAII